MHNPPIRGEPKTKAPPLQQSQWPLHPIQPRRHPNKDGSASGRCSLHRSRARAPGCLPEESPPAHRRRKGGRKTGRAAGFAALRLQFCLQRNAEKKKMWHPKRFRSTVELNGCASHAAAACRRVAACHFRRSPATHTQSVQLQLPRWMKHWNRSRLGHTEQPTQRATQLRNRN